MASKPVGGHRPAGDGGVDEAGQDAVGADAMRAALDRLSTADHGVLVALADLGPLSQQQIADGLDADKSQVVRLIDQLEERGLVTRAADPTDRRRHRITLTGPGRQLVEWATPAVRRAEDHHLRGLTPAERTTLATRRGGAAVATTSLQTHSPNRRRSTHRRRAHRPPGLAHSAHMDITCVTIDCHDPAAVAAFWNEALRWGGVAVAADGSGAVCGPVTGGTYLEFVRVPDDKIVKNRVHLGCTAGSLDDLDAEITRLQGLGATVAWEEPFPPEVAAVYRNVVLRDPEGNELCLSGGRLPATAR